MVTISAKKLIKMVKKWQKLAALQNKRMSPRNNNQNGPDYSPKASSIVDKGHFVVYTVDQVRFVVPLAYLNDSVFRELLNMSAEEYGLPSDRPITFPCDSVFMDYIIYLIQQGRAGDLHEVLLESVASSRSLSSLSHGLCEGQMNQQQLLVF